MARFLVSIQLIVWLAGWPAAVAKVAVVIGWLGDCVLMAISRRKGLASGTCYQAMRNAVRDTLTPYPASV
jgi:hypothetical protein